MKKCILIIVLFSLISACNKNNQDDGISAYKNKDYITAFALSEKGCREKNGAIFLQIYIIWGFLII